jgi:hypothetical protein
VYAAFHTLLRLPHPNGGLRVATAPSDIAAWQAASRSFTGHYFVSIPHNRNGNCLAAWISYSF